MFSAFLQRFSLGNNKSMGSYLSLRAELRNAALPPNDGNVNSAFRNANLEPFHGFCLSRYATPCRVSVIALVLIVINLTSVKSIDDADPEVHACRAKYFRAIQTLNRPNVSPGSYRLFSDALGGAHLSFQMRYATSTGETSAPCARGLAIQRTRRASSRDDWPPRRPKIRTVSNRPRDIHQAAFPRTRMAIAPSAQNAFRFREDPFPKCAILVPLVSNDGEELCREADYLPPHPKKALRLSDGESSDHPVMGGLGGGERIYRIADPGRAN